MQAEEGTTARSPAVHAVALCPVFLFSWRLHGVCVTVMLGVSTHLGVGDQ
jgi:hypothetical protein